MTQLFKNKSHKISQYLHPKNSTHLIYPCTACTGSGIYCFLVDGHPHTDSPQAEGETYAMQTQRQG